METRRRRGLVVLLIASVMLAISAQFYFANKRAFMWDGIVLYALAMALFARLAAKLEARPRADAQAAGPSLWQELWEALRRNVVRLGALVVGLVLITYVTAAANSRHHNMAFGDLLILWAVSIALAVAAFVDWRGLPDGLRRGWAGLRRHSFEASLVGALVAATFLLRAINLEGIPFVLGGDEASMGLEAVRTMEGKLNNPFATGWLSHPTLYFFLLSIPLRLFGTSTSALRLLSPLCSAGIALLLYLFARRYYGRRIALLATIYFSAYHFAIHYGRLAMNNIWDPFFALGVLYFLTRGLEEKRRGFLAIAGALAGLCVYFYMGARLIPFIVLVYLVHWALSERDFLRDHLVHLLIVGLVAVVAALPLLVFWSRHPQDMVARWNLLGIFPSGWVKQTQASTGRSVFSIVFEQFLKSVLAYNYYPDPTFWYHPQIPLLQFIPSIFFVFGLTYALWQWRKREYFLLVAWYLLVIIFGGTLLENPPSSMRLVLSIPPAVLCLALGVMKLASYVQRVLAPPRHTASALALVLVLLMSYQSAYFYFGKYTPSRVYAGHNTEVADRMGKYLRVLGPSYRCYFFGAPRMYYGFATIPFLAPGVQGTDVTQPLKSEAELKTSPGPAVFVFLPERRGEMEIVLRIYPEGLLREFRDQKGQILFIAYEVEG